MKSINPATGKVVATFETHDKKKVDHILAASASAFNQLRKTSIAKRSTWMLNIADRLLRDKAHFANLMTIEMGKMPQEAIAEVEKCAWVCRYYAERAESFLKDEMIETDARKSYVTYQPLGPVLAVMPWNFPFWQVFRFAAPTLMAGNSGLLKHASNVPQCALAIEDIFSDSGFPEDSFRTLLIPGSDVEQVIADPRVTAVTLTGSGPAGKAVAAAAGKNLKKSLLELGGSDPYIICEDADLDDAVDICINGRLLNCGQSCIGAKRFIAVGSAYDQFLEKFAARMEDVRLADPDNPDSGLGPMASTELRDELHAQVKDSEAAGAHVVTGGYVPDGAGAYYPPTILTDVSPGMRAYAEELFGPVAVVFKVPTIEAAIQIANDTSFGLGACVLTRDLEQGEKIARSELMAGCCFVNAQVKSDPRLPFGGIRDSGYGRELSVQGIREFVNVKTVYIG